MREVEGTGLGKVILLGEHAVVHGVPAVALTLDRSVTVAITDLPKAPDLEGPAHTAFRQMADQLGVGPVHAEIRSSSLPVGAGLGGSAAFSVACARALQAWAERDPDAIDEVLWLADIGESVFHGNPSGIDAQCSVRSAGAAIRFERGVPPKITPLTCPSRPALVIADTGERAPTRDLVEAVAATRRDNPLAISALFDIIGALVTTATEFLKSSDWPALGKSLNAAHSILGRLGVSTPRLDEACQVAREAGATGAKLTGGGGGGCVVALADDRPAAEAIRDALHARGYDAFLG